MSHSTVAILGGGPIGLEALLACIEHGFSTILYEKNKIGGNIQQWQHVRLFSPFGLNRSHLGAQLLTDSGTTLPTETSLLTGEEYLNSYLIPLSQLPQLQSAIKTSTCVEKIGKENLLKSDLIGSPQRTHSRFRLLINQQGRRTIATADYVLDCTGTFGNHNWLGNGGIPCLGEQEFSERICYGLPAIQVSDREDYIGKSTLVIGSGYSAATNVVALAELIKEDASTQVYWLTRHDRTLPMTPIPDDTLVERDSLTQRANELAVDQATGVRRIRNGVVESIAASGIEDSKLEVIVTHGDGRDDETLRVDSIIANVGFRPDRSLSEELQIHECYATHGPMKLAATLMGETSADCLAQSSHGVETLKSPEPNFYILGAKSYGRSSRFLIKIGIEQIAEVMQEIACCQKLREA